VRSFLLCCGVIVVVIVLIAVAVELILPAA